MSRMTPSSGPGTFPSGPHGRSGCSGHHIRDCAGARAGAAAFRAGTIAQHFCSGDRGGAHHLDHASPRATPGRLGRSGIRPASLAGARTCGRCTGIVVGLSFGLAADSA